MEMEAEAERRRRAEVLQSEGDRQSEASLVGELGRGRAEHLPLPQHNIVYTRMSRTHTHARPCTYIYT